MKAHLAYNNSLKYVEEPDIRWWHTTLWRIKIARKIKYFIWLTMNNKILTWDALQHCGFTGLGRCIFFRVALESTEHMFGRCSFSNRMGHALCQQLGGVWWWELPSLVENFEQWKSRSRLSLAALCLFLWEYWKTRNANIFQEVLATQAHIISKVCSSPFLELSIMKNILPRQISLPIEQGDGITGYFNGAA